MVIHVNLVGEKRLTPWTLHRLEAYATLIYGVWSDVSNHLPGGPRTDGNHAEGLM